MELSERNKSVRSYIKRVDKEGGEEEIGKLPEIFPSKAAMIRLRIGNQMPQSNPIYQGLEVRAPSH
jgi:hypothetical protein